MEGKTLHSKSKTIEVTKIRQLKELSSTLDVLLTEKEFLDIALIYNQVIERLLKENNLK